MFNARIPTRRSSRCAVVAKRGALHPVVVCILFAPTLYASSLAPENPPVIQILGPTFWEKLTSIGAVAMALTIVLLWARYRYRKEATESGRQPSFHGLVSYWVVQVPVTVLFSLALMAAIGWGHSVLGALFGHDPLGSMVAVGFMKFVEKIFHRLYEIPKAVMEAVLSTVPAALENMKIFVTGTLHSAKLKEMVKVIEGHETLGDCPNGISIFWFQATPDDYASVCRHFLKTSERIESMSDMDLDKALPLFKDKNRPVMQWINEVNEKRSAVGDTVVAHRVLALTVERLDFLRAVERLQENDADPDSKSVVLNYSRLPTRKLINGLMPAVINEIMRDAMRGLANFYADYCNSSGIPVSILVRHSAEIGGGLDSRGGAHNGHELLPRGEFIIFDRKYLVRFNSEAKLLEIFIGQLVNTFAEVFDAADLVPFPPGTKFSALDIGLHIGGKVDA